MTEDPDAGASVIVAPRILRESLPRPARTAGGVDLSVSIDATGEVTEAHVVKSPSSELSASAIDAIGRMQFSPALQDDRPVAVQFAFTYHFAATPLPTAQPLSILNGEVLSRGTRQPIPDAEVVIDPEVDGGLSTVAGAGGTFSTELPVGSHQVLVRAVGYEPHTFPEALAPGQKLEVKYRLTPTGGSPYQSFVYAPSERTEISRVALTGAEIHDVAGTMGDPLRVVMLLPGVGTVASGIAYPVVRGSDPSDTGYYIDGIPVPILFHLLLGPEVLSPDFIDSVDFYPSNPPADEGRHLTGAVSLTSKAPRDSGAHVTAYADLINAGAFGEVSFPETGTSIAAAARTSYTGWLTELASKALTPAGSGALVLAFSDYQVRIDQALAGGHLRLFIFGSSDDAGIGATSNEAAEIGTVQFVRADLRYRHPLAGGEAEVGVTLGQDEVGESESFNLGEKSIRFRGSWKRELGAHLHLLVGMDADYRKAELAVGGTGANPLNFDAEQLASEGLTGVGATAGSFSGVYAELTWRPTARWSVTSGFRLDNYYRDPDIDDLAAEPRLSGRYQLRDDLALRAGAGMVHEPPVLLIDLPAVVLGGLGHGLQSGMQTELGVEWTFVHGNQLDATAYFNPLFRTVEFGVPGGNLATAAETIAPPDLDPVSKGYAFGLELMVRRPLGGNWFGWVSCALAWNLRYQTYDLLNASGEPTGASAGGYLPFAFDETLIANAALTYRLPRGWSVGGVVHFNTGRPEDGVLGSYTQVPGTLSGQPAWIPAQLNQVARLPPFYRIDLQVSKSWILDLMTLQGYFDLLNATVSWETFGSQYSTITAAPTGAPGAAPVTSLSKTPISIPIVAPMLGMRETY